jgi:nitroreductase
MEFFDVLKNRHSVRRFSNQRIEPEKINIILQSANSAPSAGNLQAYKIFIVNNSEKLKAIAISSANQLFIKDSPLVLIFCAYPEYSSRKYGDRGLLYSIEDATISCSYAQLTAIAIGLSSVWVGAIDENVIKQTLELKDNILPISILCVGYSNEIPRITPRIYLSDLVYEIN